MLLVCLMVGVCVVVVDAVGVGVGCVAVTGVVFVVAAVGLLGLMGVMANGENGLTEICLRETGLLVRMVWAVGLALVLGLVLAFGASVTSNGMACTLTPLLGEAAPLVWLFGSELVAVFWPVVVFVFALFVFCVAEFVVVLAAVVMAGVGSATGLVYK